MHAHQGGLVSDSACEVQCQILHARLYWLTYYILHLCAETPLLKHYMLASLIGASDVPSGLSFSLEQECMSGASTHCQAGETEAAGTLAQLLRDVHETPEP